MSFSEIHIRVISQRVFKLLFWGGVTKAPFVKIFDLAKVRVTFFESHSFDSCHRSWANMCFGDVEKLGK